MNSKEDFLYTKKIATKELFHPHVADKSGMETDKLSLPKDNCIAGYCKGEGTLSINLFCVISGGTTREKVFLNELCTKRTFSRLRVLFVSTEKGEGGLTPKMMWDRFEKIYREKVIITRFGKTHLEEIDKFYMLTDVDHYMEELISLAVKKKSYPCSWIISNPDFEIWLYYCFRNNPEEELDEVVNARPSMRSSLLKRVNGNFNNKGGLDPRKAFEYMQQGIQHAKEHYQEDSNGIPLLLSTNMFLFAEEALEKVGDEFEEWKRMKQIDRKIF